MLKTEGKEAIMIENKLHVYCNDAECWIAESFDDLKAMMFGENSIFGGSDLFDPEDWQVAADDKAIPINESPYFKSAITKTAAEWAEAIGAGFLCSTDGDR